MIWMIHSSIILLFSIFVAYLYNSKVLFKRSIIYFCIFAFTLGLASFEILFLKQPEDSKIFFYMGASIIYNIILNGIILLISFYKSETYFNKINLKFLIPYFVLVVGGHIAGILICFINILNIYADMEMIRHYAYVGINIFSTLALLTQSLLYKHKNKFGLIFASIVSLGVLGFEIYEMQPLYSITSAILIFFIYNALESGINYLDINEYNFSGDIFEKKYKKISKGQSILYISIYENETSDELVLNKIFKHNFYKINPTLFAIVLKDNKMDFIVENLDSFIKFYIGDAEIKLKYNTYYVDYQFLNEKNFKVEDITDYLKSITFKDENKLTIINEDNEKAILENKKLLSMIDDAIKNDGFEMYYQPIYSTKNDKFISAEALIRFKDKETLGFISPEVFIPLAEKKGYAEEIGKLVFRKVCSFYKEYDLSKKYNIKYIELNVSGLHITTKTIVNDFKKILEEYELKPENINIEITETAEILNKRQMNENLSNLRKLGFKFSMDDFGSGYSNLTNLVTNGYELIKIDKSLLWDAFKEGWKQDDSKILLETCINLGHFLHRHIVVEGVETKEMVVFLKERNVEYLQGYFYSKPIPEKEFIKFIEDNNFNEEREIEASEFLIENLLK